MRDVPTPHLVHWGFSCRLGLLYSANLWRNLELDLQLLGLDGLSEALGPIPPTPAFPGTLGVAPRIRIFLALW